MAGPRADQCNEPGAGGTTPGATTNGASRAHPGCESPPQGSEESELTQHPTEPQARPVPEAAGRNRQEPKTQQPGLAHTQRERKPGECGEMHRINRTPKGRRGRVRSATTCLPPGIDARVVPAPSLFVRQDSGMHWEPNPGTVAAVAGRKPPMLPGGSANGLLRSRLLD